MKLAQNKIRWLARLMLMLVLFAQGVVAVHASVAPNFNPVRAFAIGQHEEGAAHDVEAGHCHEEESPNANACLTHCTQSDQISVDQHDVPLAAPASVIAWVSNRPQAQPFRTRIVTEQVAPDTGPPIPIRFCSFLN